MKRIALAALTALLLWGAYASASRAAGTVMPGSEERVRREIYERFSDVKNARYCVKERDGYVAVFENGAEEPFRRTDIPVALLPGADRAMVRRGMAAADRDALIRLLEDLGP